MRQLPNDKYSIAWFKLADFVSRGEKERALGLYRLLMHSIDDQAFSYQLEGDLLLSFNDQTAIDKYCAAAQLYKEQQRLIQAAAIYEHLHYLQPMVAHYLQMLCQVYTSLDFESQLGVSIERLCCVVLHHNQPELLLEFLQTDQSFSQDHKGYIARQLVVYWLKQPSYDLNHVLEHAYTGLELLLLKEDRVPLREFLNNIRALNELAYQNLCTKIEVNKKGI